MAAIVNKRGFVYRVRFTPPDRPKETKEKFVLCIHEGPRFQNSPLMVIVVLTSIKEKETREFRSPLYVPVGPEESQTKFGAVIDCAWIYTIPKSCIIEYAYALTSATMEAVDRALAISLGLAKP